MTTTKKSKLSLKINKISFFNIGDSSQKGQDYFDVIKRGVCVLHGQTDECILVKYKNNNTVETERLSYLEQDYWDLAAKFIIAENKFKASYDLIKGLILCADSEDEDGLYDYMQDNGGEVIFDSPTNDLENVGYFCIKQVTIDDFEYNNNKVIFKKKEMSLENLNGSLDDLSASLVYLKK
jgi:hypothetical protein